MSSRKELMHSELDCFTREGLRTVASFLMSCVDVYDMQAAIDYVHDNYPEETYDD